MLSTFVLPLVRHLMTGLGAALIAKGYLDTAGVDLLSGIAINAVSLGWMVWAKLKTK